MTGHRNGASSAAGPVADRPGRNDARPTPAGGAPVGDFHRPDRLPYWLTTVGIRVLVGSYLRVRVEGRANLPSGPALLAFTHVNWTDPFVLVAALPARPDLLFFGPREANMRRGARNRLISWSGRSIPFKPDGSDVRDVTRALEAALATGARVAIAPEGRIHAGERELLPLSPGAAWFALHAGVPLVPIGTTGLGWVRFGRTVRVRIGRPILPHGRPTRAAVDAMSEELREALCDLVADGRNESPPGPIGRWVTEVFNDWPEGVRPVVPPD